MPRGSSSPCILRSISGLEGALAMPEPVSITLTSSASSLAERITPTQRLLSSWFPCSMALMHASARAVLRSSMRSSGKPMSLATLAAVPIATFSKPSRDGSFTSTAVPLVSTILVFPRLHAHQCECRHVVLLRFSPGKFSQLLPQDLEDSSTILRLALAKCRQQTLWTEFVIALKHFREPIGIEEQPRSRVEDKGFRAVLHPRDQADGRAARLNLMHCLIRGKQKPGVVARVHQLDGVHRRVQLEKDRGHVAALRFLAFAVVLLVHTRSQFGERQPGKRHRAKGRSEGSRDDGRSQSLARNIGHHHELASIGQTDQIHVVAAHLVTGA